MLKRHLQYFSHQTKRFQHITALLAVLIVASIGTYLLVGSHATSPYVSNTADSGTLSGGATSQTCNGASNGNCVTFGSTNTQLLSYPPSYYNSSNTIVTGLVGTSEDQLTNLVADQSKISGVVLLLYWSQIEPKQGCYNWSVIDQAINYWQAKGKKVVINIAPYGVPVDFTNQWASTCGPTTGISDGLPGWLINLGAKTLPSYSLKILNSLTDQTADVSVPIPFDPIYLAQYGDFIKQLGERYNGNPGVAYVRIGLGKESEETYPFFCTYTASNGQTYTGDGTPDSVCQAAIADGLTPTTWYNSVLQVAADYKAAFPNTQLSVELLLAGFFNNPNLDYMGQSVYQYQAQAQRLIDYAEANNIMLANNGLNDGALTTLQTGQPDSNSVVFQLLRNASQAGHPVEVEAYGPLFNSEMANPTAILQAIQIIKPRYVNFFGDLYGVDDYLNNNVTPTSQADWNQFNSIKTSQGLTDQQVQARAAAWQNLINTLAQ